MLSSNDINVVIAVQFVVVVIRSECSIVRSLYRYTGRCCIRGERTIVVIIVASLLVVESE